MANNLVPGPRYLVEGMRLITRPGLRRFVALPLAVNILVFAGALYGGAIWFQELITWLQQRLPTLPDWLAWLEQGLAWVLWPLFILLAVVLFFQGFSLVANLIAAPFNGLLAEKVAKLLAGAPPERTGGLGQSLIDIPSSLLDETRKLLHVLLWAIPFFILSLFLPLVGPLLWFVFTAWVLALEYLDYPMANQGLKAREIRQRLRQRPLLSLGFGAAAALLTLIPVLNFIAMPSAVAGATALWVKEYGGREGAGEGKNRLQPRQ